MELGRALAENGVEVIIVDRNGQVVHEAARIVMSAVQGDATSEKSLRDAGFEDCDVAVVAVGASVEVSTLATANCKEIGIKTVIAKASSELHGRILSRIGADRVIYPESESAHRLARALKEHGGVDLMELGEGYSIAEIDVLKSWTEKTLVELDLRKHTGITVLCIRRMEGRKMTTLIPTATDQLLSGDKLIVLGKTKHIDVLKEE